MQRSHARTLRAMCCPTSSLESVALRPSIAVDFPLHRSVHQFIFSIALARFSDDTVSCSTRCKDPSFVAIEPPTLPVLQPSVGNSVNTLLRMPYVAGSVSTDMDSVALLRCHDG